MSNKPFIRAIRLRRIEEASVETACRADLGARTTEDLEALGAAALAGQDVPYLYNNKRSALAVRVLDELRKRGAGDRFWRMLQTNPPAWAAQWQQLGRVVAEMIALAERGIAAVRTNSYAGFAHARQIADLEWEHAFRGGDVGPLPRVNFDVQRGVMVQKPAA